MNLPDFTDLIEQESAAQRQRFQSQDNFKQLKREGLLLHPIHVSKKSYGYLDYPEFTFKVPFQQNSQNFRSGSPIEIVTDNERIKAILLNFDGRMGECRIYKSDFPEEVHNSTCGIQLTYDEHTNNVMQHAIKHLDSNARTASLYKKIYSNYDFQIASSKEELNFRNDQLNESQKNAIRNVLPITPLGVLHGPPGTGKTTTIIELVYQKIKKGQNVLITAPSNAAIDHIGRKLKDTAINFIRLGNNSKVDEAIRPYTIEGKMEESNLQQKIKKLRIQSEQYRKMATAYKRNFGKDERDQRKLLLQEVKNIRTHIQQLQEEFAKEYLSKTNVLIGTPVSIYDARLDYDGYDTLIVDEAAQCLDPLIWAVAPLAHQLVLVGDPYQLPPTVLSNNDLKKTMLERLIENDKGVHLLQTQYRMPKELMQFSNDFFYNGKLLSKWTHDGEFSYKFFDTAGSEALEKKDEDTGSIYNEEEVNFVVQLIEKFQIHQENTVIITPYSAQVSKLKQALPNYRVSTIDSIQGQEAETIILSLVRSNTSQTIGFLQDYRRMNVALTRSKRNLYIIGDSTTITNDAFYKQLIKNLETQNGYDSVFTLIY